MDIQTPYLIIFLMAIIIMYNFYEIYKLKNTIKGVEGFEDPEAIANLASLYNQENMKVTNLEITGKLNVKGDTTLQKTTMTNANIPGKVIAGSGKIGSWEIRADRIGIPARGDIQLHTDKWCRLLDYNGNTGAYAGTANSAGGFAGKNLWAGQGRVWSNNMCAGGTCVSENNLKTLTGQRDFKLFSPYGSEAPVCNGGYVMSGGNCTLMNGGGSHHKGAWATDARRVRFRIVY